MQETQKEFNQSALDVNREFIRGDIIDFLSGYGVNSTKCRNKEKAWIASARNDIKMVIFPESHHDRMLIAFDDPDHGKLILAVFHVKLLGSGNFEYGEDING